MVRARLLIFPSEIILSSCHSCWQHHYTPCYSAHYVGDIFAPSRRCPNLSFTLLRSDIFAQSTLLKLSCWPSESSSAFLPLHIQTSFPHLQGLAELGPSQLIWPCLYHVVSCPPHSPSDARIYALFVSSHSGLQFFHTVLYAVPELVPRSLSPSPMTHLWCDT